MKKGEEFDEKQLLQQQQLQQQKEPPSPMSLSSAADAAAAAAADAKVLQSDDDDDDLHAWPTSTEVVQELKQMGGIACPIVVTGLLVYLRSLISMLFLGHLGELQLAGGSLAIGFANITGYSVLSGLAMGMEPICGQAFGAKRWKLMGLTMQRTILFLLSSCCPIALLWINMRRILIFCGQDPQVTTVAHTYLLFSLPDLLAQSILYPLRIFLRTQNITLPLTVCAGFALLLHIPINMLLVLKLGMGIEGVALSAAITNFNMLWMLVAYIRVSGIHKRCWEGWSRECLSSWAPLLTLAIPSCLSVCLEWWWYELMIIFSGLLINARAAVATMGVLIQTTALVYIFPSSLGLAVSTRVGNELGANHPRGARVAAHVALCCAVFLGLAAACFTTGMRHVWGTMFTSDAAILKLTAMAMPVVGLCELGNCPQTTGCGVLRGSARPSLGANINLGSFYFVGMPVAMVLGFLMNVGFVGLWLGLLAAQASCLVLMLFVILRTDWRLQALRAQELTGAAADNSLKKACFELVSQEDLEDLEKGSDKVAETGAAAAAEKGAGENVPLVEAEESNAVAAKCEHEEPKQQQQQQEWVTGVPCLVFCW